MYCFVVLDCSRACSFYYRKLNKLLKRLIALILASESILRQKMETGIRVLKIFKRYSMLFIFYQYGFCN